MIKIDNEFKALIPPLMKDEYEQLEKNILKEGIREPVLLWGNTIIDGHNRYEIAMKHNLRYRTVEKTFKSRQEVIEWMILNQFGRRNLSAYQRSLLALKLKPVFEEKAKENKVEAIRQAEQFNSKKQDSFSQNSAETKKEIKTIDTREELSKIANVSHDTMAKVQKIEEKAPEKLKEKMSNGDISINKGYEITKAIEKISVDKVDSFVEKAMEDKKSINKIIQDMRREEKKEELEYLEPPKGKYKVIYADPPWSYGDKRAPQTGGCEDHYITMRLKDICELPVEELSEDNAVLFMWVTSPLIQEGLEVVKAWGFKYKAMFIVVVVSSGNSHFFIDLALIIIYNKTLETHFFYILALKTHNLYGYGFFVIFFI